MQRMWLTALLTLSSCAEPPTGPDGSSTTDVGIDAFAPVDAMAGLDAVPGLDAMSGLDAMPDAMPGLDAMARDAATRDAPGMPVDAAPDPDTSALDAGAMDHDAPAEDVGPLAPDVGDEPHRCGDGRRDPDETCDGDCPTDCDDGDPCTNDALLGSADTCTAVCTTEPVIACLAHDACCPSHCGGLDLDCGCSLSADGCCAVGTLDDPSDPDCAAAHCEDPTATAPSSLFHAPLLRPSESEVWAAASPAMAVTEHGLAIVWPIGSDDVLEPSFALELRDATGARTFGPIRIAIPSAGTRYAVTRGGLSALAWNPATQRLFAALPVSVSGALTYVGVELDRAGTVHRSVVLGGGLTTHIALYADVDGWVYVQNDRSLSSGLTSLSVVALDRDLGRTGWSITHLGSPAGSAHVPGNVFVATTRVSGLDSGIVVADGDPRFGPPPRRLARASMLSPFLPSFWDGSAFVTVQLAYFSGGTVSVARTVPGSGTTTWLAPFAEHAPYRPSRVGNALWTGRDIAVAMDHRPDVTGTLPSARAAVSLHSPGRVAPLLVETETAGIESWETRVAMVGSRLVVTWARMHEDGDWEPMIAWLVCP